MKRICAAVLALALILGLMACRSEESNTADETKADDGMTWQEQYDLGIRLLNEGKYEEAILAFTAAIQIDPKRVDAYVGRGDVYSAWAANVKDEAAASLGEGESLILSAVKVETGSGEYTLEDLYQSAAEDYEEVLEQIRGGEAPDVPSETEKDVREKLADTLIDLAEILLENPDEEGNREKAQEYLDQAAELTEDSEKLARIEELLAEAADQGQTTVETRLPVGYRRVYEYMVDNGEVPAGWIRVEYDETGNKIKEVSVDGDGNDGYTTVYDYDKNGHELPWYYINGDYREYDSDGLLTSTGIPYSDGSVKVSALCFYDENGNVSEIQWMFDSNGTPGYFLYYFYDSENRLEHWDFYNQGGASHSSSAFYHYDREGRLVQIEEQSYYSAGNIGYGYTDYEYNEAGQLVFSSYTGGSGTVYYTAEYLYNENGELIRENHYDDNPETGGNYYVEYIYEE